ISHDLSQAAREVERAYQLIDTNYNRWQADTTQLEVLQRRYREGADNINFLLQAQRQLVTSQSDFYRSLRDYNLAIRDLHRQKGSLLAYNEIHLSEGAWKSGAQHDAYQKGRHLMPRFHPEKVNVPPPLSRGLFDPAATQTTSPAVLEDAGQAASPATTHLPTPAAALDPVN
ncbi:MAG: TolC family protein, partial [Planctomycetota bacterium]